MVTGRAMRTCWVFDHPAHIRLLAPFLRAGQSDDVIIATKRKEVENLLKAGDGHISRRQTHWVERPVGEGRSRLQTRKKALMRWGSSHQFLRQCNQQGRPIERIVSIGAPLELMAWRSPILRRRLSSIVERWYISDTEVNHIAHRLARNAATDVVLPTHWRSDLDGGFSQHINGVRVHRLDGLHGHVHLRPSIRPSIVSDPPRVLVRRLIGGGIHDDDELIEIPHEVFDGLSTTLADEDAYTDDAWALDRELAAHDCVITQSVTLASEAALLGTPTLLISKAQRGFLDRLESEGYPLFRWKSSCEGDEWKDLQAQFLTGIHLTEMLEPEAWPNAQKQLAEFLQIKLID